LDKKRRSDGLEWRKEKKAVKEKMKTKSQWLGDLQKVFNQYIRLRDRNKPCISCGRSLTGKYDAGHFFSVGAYPNLRFDEDNVHGQCVECNQHRHGNIGEYSIRLPQRIGQDRFNRLLDLRNVELKLSVEEIKTMIDHYRKEVKCLSSEK